MKSLWSFSLGDLIHRSFARKSLCLAVATLVCGTFAHASAQQYQPRLIVPGVGAGIGADLAASPDGKWFVTSSTGPGDNVATIWSTADGSEYRSFPTGNYACCVNIGYGPSASLSVSPDSRIIAAASGNEVRLFDAQTAKQIGALGVEAPVVRVAYHPSRNLIAVLDMGGTLSIFDQQRPQPTFRQTVDPQSFFLHFSADGSLLVTGSSNAVRVVDWEHGKVQAQFDARATETRDLSRKLNSMVISPGGSGFQMQTAEQLGFYSFSDAAFSPDAKKLALVQHDQFSVIDLATKSKVATIPVDGSPALACVFVSNDKLIVGLQGNLSIEYQISTRQQTSFPVTNVRSFVPIPGSSNLLMNLFSGFGGVVIMKSVAGTGGWVSRPDGKLANSLAAAFSPDNKELLAGITWATSPMTSWNLESGEADTSVLPLEGVGNFAVSPDGSLVAWYGDDAGYPDMKVYVWNRKTATRQLSLPITVSASPERLAFSSDGSRLAAVIGQDGGTQPKVVRIWSIPSGKVLGDIPVKSSFLVEFAWQPVTNLLAIAKTGGLMLIDASSGNKPSTIKTLDPMPLQSPAGIESFSGNNLFGSVRFSPDGKWLAAYENGAIALVDTANWTLQSSVSNASVSNFEFSPDSRRLLYIEQVDPQNVWGAARLAFWDVRTKSKRAAGPPSPIGSIYSQNRDGSLIAGSAAGGIGLFSGTTGELLAILYRFGNGKSTDWLAVTPDGFFDGTPGAWNQLKWRFSDETFDVAPVEVFFQNFYHPGLLAEIASGNLPKAPTNIADIDRRQPAVHLTVAQDISAPVHDRIVHIDITVEQAQPDGGHHEASGARDLRLFRNGTLVQAWRGPLTLDLEGKAHLATDVPIVAGENRFTAYAFSSANIKSPDASLVLQGVDQLRRQGIAWVISMGVNHYSASTPQRNFDLHFSEGDASDFAGQFSGAQTAIGYYADVRRIDLFGANATRANLETALRLLAGDSPAKLSSDQESLFPGIAAVQPEDGVFIFYAGHGTAANNHFYLIPRDYDPSVSPDNPRSRAISDLDLSRMLEGIAPARSFLVIDACNSGQAIDSATPVGPMNSMGLAQLAYEKGLYILAASKDSEPALETQALGGGHGFLTYALVEEGLKSGAAAVQGQVELRPWFEYAGRRVPELQADQLARRALNIDPADLPKETRQHPRIFYRREPEADPFVVARIAMAAAQPANNVQ